VTSPYEPAKLHKHARTSRRAGRDAATLIRLGHWCGLLTAAGGCLVLTAYALDIEAILRPVPAGPSTHPITAILFIIGGAAVASVRAMQVPRVAVAALLVVALVAAGRLLETASGVNILQLASPFQSTLAREAAEGMPVAVGWNSAVMFILVALAFLMRYLRRPRTGQVIAAAGMAPPLVALSGYVYGVAEFYGQMSVTTVILGLLFSMSPLLLSARTTIMRAICSPWDGGRFGRLEIAVITAILSFGGFAVQRSSTTADRVIPIFVVLTILVASTTIAFCTIVIERNDWLRRRGERTIVQLVLRDALSGLYNRRFLKEQEKGIIDFAGRMDYQLCVLMIDIDRFKGVNDTYGHPAGDKVIRRVADTIRNQLRSSDITIRYGGEEILAILLDVELDAAARVAEKLRALIESVDFSDVGFRKLTVSIGVAQAGHALREAIGRADVALYLAKQSGRNRVVADETGQGTALVPSTQEQPADDRISA
jgi:diguanylate cyclase (GGDEF)-like protein